MCPIPIFHLPKFKNERLSSQDMKLLLIHTILIFPYIDFRAHCLPIEEQTPLGDFKNNREMWDYRKIEKHDPDENLKLNKKTKEDMLYPDPRIEPETELEDCSISSSSENKINTKEKLQKEIPYSMEQLATTANPTTKSPHGFIYPGTKWCGDGDKAVNDDDLGSKEATDRCCRDHDHCNDYILPGETKYNLTNLSSHASMSCECDDIFYDCLQRANTDASHSVGSLFFNFGSIECFAFDYPKRCKKTVPLFGFCYEYEVDTTAEKVYQFMSSKKYRKS